MPAKSNKQPQSKKSKAKYRALQPWQAAVTMAEHSPVAAQAGKPASVLSHTAAVSAAEKNRYTYIRSELKRIGIIAAVIIIILVILAFTL